MVPGCQFADQMRFVLKMQNPQRIRLRIIAKRREKMKKKKLSIFIVPGNYEEKKG